jgi:probable F420-dependent oxidoreductase
MRIGICLPQLGPGSTPDVVDEFIGRAEEAGFDSLWVQEHLFRPLGVTTPYGAREGAPWPAQHQRLLAPFELLAYAAARTTRCTLGTSIAVAGYHHPVDLAKRAATIDALARGRMALGLGTGWSQDEYELLGVPFKRRGSLADEMLEALLACWGPNPVSYQGEHFVIPASETSPKPFAGDRVRLVGGFMGRNGERRSARFCDVWQPYAMEADEARRRLDVVNEIAAAEFGRGPLELSLRVTTTPEIPGLLGGGVSSSGRWAGGIGELRERGRAAAKSGCDELVLDTSFAAGPSPEGTASARSWLAQPEFFRPLVETAHAGQ